MIITRAPFRVSFFGGGSDMPYFYEKYGGCVLCTSINKYLYIAIHPFFDTTRIQLKYSKSENVELAEEIDHKIFRKVLMKYALKGVELTSTADIPSGTGLGSSSTFTVALLNAVYCYLGKYRSKQILASEATEIEIKDLLSPIGKQDQYASAFGGLNFIEFHKNGVVNVEPIVVENQKLKDLESRLMLFYLNTTRDTNSILMKQTSKVKDNPEKEQILLEQTQLTREVRNMLEKGNINDFGKMLDHGWKLKRSLMDGISNKSIDEIYEKGLAAGAEGGKLLGAGGGGFMLFYCLPEKQKQLIQSLQLLKHVPFNFDNTGAQVIFYDN